MNMCTGFILYIYVSEEFCLEERKRKLLKDQNDGPLEGYRTSTSDRPPTDDRIKGLLKRTSGGSDIFERPIFPIMYFISRRSDYRLVGLLYAYLMQYNQSAMIFNKRLNVDLDQEQDSYDDVSTNNIYKHLLDLLAFDAFCVSKEHVQIVAIFAQTLPTEDNLKRVYAKEDFYPTLSSSTNNWYKLNPFMNKNDTTRWWNELLLKPYDDLVKKEGNSGKKKTCLIASVKK